MNYILWLVSLVFIGGVFWVSYNCFPEEATLFVFIVLAMGLTIGLLLGFAFMLSRIEKMASYKRQLEKVSVNNDSNESKVEVLEEKIKTLEKALEKALEN